MLKVALTGGIATGKTYVLGRFRELGVPTLDTDALAREAVRPGSPGSSAVRARFGSAVFTPAGDLDRAKLASIVFADPAARADLEAIVHPEVYRSIQRWFDQLQASTPSALGIADVPLLYETGHESDFDRVIVVACDPRTELDRVVARNGLSEQEARQRIAAQWPIERKAGRADFVVRTDATMEETDRQVREVYDRLLSEERRTQNKER